MRVRPPKADVLSPTSKASHESSSTKGRSPLADLYYYYKNKENVSGHFLKTPRFKLTRSEVNVTTPLGLHSHNSRSNLNTANTKVNACALRRRASNDVAISPLHQPKRIKTEQPEHKVTSLAHPKPTKREHANKSTSSGGPVASLNNAGTKVNAGVLRPRVLNHVAVSPHQHTRINREQLDHKVTSLACPPPAKREHAVKSLSSGGPVASLNAYTKVNAGALHNVSNLAITITTHQHKRINTEQPEHNYARSEHPKPTKREHADESTSSGGPVAKRIKTEQPEHKVASSVQPKPTASSVQPKPTKREEHADRSTSRPTVENESSWLRKKLAYIDMVKRHMTESPDERTIASVTHAKTELLSLMTHVAGQTRSDSTQWQHPSDLTCRKYRRTPLVHLGPWKEHYSKMGRRFSRVPHSFYRTPVYL